MRCGALESCLRRLNFGVNEDLEGQGKGKGEHIQTFAGDSDNFFHWFLPSSKSFYHVGIF